MGVFNAQHPSWGSFCPNQIGRNFKDSLLNCPDLIILNDKSPTRISIKASCPDLAICSSNILDKLSFSVGKDSFESDHFPLSVSMNNFDRFQAKPQNIFSLTRVNWTIFSSEMAKVSLFKDDNFANVNSSLESLYSAIKDAVVKAGGKVRKVVSISMHGSSQVSTSHRDVKKKRKLSDAPWWDVDCSKIVDKRRFLLDKFKSDPSVENLIEYKNFAKEASSSLSIRKKENFREFISTMDPSRPLLSNFHIIKKFKNRFYSPNPSSIDSKCISNNVGLMDAFDKIASSYS